MEQVSWQVYVMSVVLVTGTYYLYVGFRYYRQDFKNLLNKVFQPPERQTVYQDPEEEPIQIAELEALSQASRTMEQVFDELTGIEVTKEEAISVAREYLSGFKQPVFRISLSQLVSRKVKEAFKLELTPDELRAIWE
ncbi:hypothetical protein GCM10023091_00540 [Ravibacter arvi]|uniref:Uncharacterized protein n=1 Tax=Ravibacter arvi TaxID=2051041 RepID=A0ABP8LJB0_9BACT